MGLYKQCRCQNKQKCGHPYHYSYMSPDGIQIRRSSKTTDKRIASEKLTTIKNQIIMGSYKPEPVKKHTFIELVDLFKKEHVDKLRSKKSYYGYINNLSSFFSKFMLSDISAKSIIEYKEQRNEEGVLPATINRDLACLSRMFSFAIKTLEWIEFNPLTRVSREPEDNERDVYLTHEEESFLIFEIGLEYLRDIVEFDIDTGLRLSELLTLTWGQINWDHSFITVSTYKTGKIGKPKKRSIPLTKRALHILEKRIKIQKPQNTTERVFVNTLNQPVLSLRNPFEEAVKRAVKKSNKFNDFVFHDLRHTFATRLAQSGIDLYIIQRLLGHSDPKTTQRYAHHCVNSLKVGTRKLDELFYDRLKDLAVTGIEKEVEI